jgi:dipeptidyl aminopeptidase/acylaminoacyl peptidase
VRPRIGARRAATGRSESNPTAEALRCRRGARDVVPVIHEHSSRVSAVVAAQIFSDLRTVATERAPFFFAKGTIARAFVLAEQQGHFRVDDASPVRAAAGVRVPVLLIHGAADIDTPPSHSRRVLAALAGPKRLILVPGARHNESLGGDVWGDIERWLDDVLGSKGAG